MEYETFEIEIEGYKIGVSNDPKYTKNGNLVKRGLYECFLRTQDRYAICLVSKEFLQDKNTKPLLLKMLLKEIKRIPAT